VDPAKLVALLTGVGGLGTAAGGVLLAVRAARDKERKAAKREIDELGGMLSSERHQRLEAERRNYDLSLRLAQHGIDPEKPYPGHRVHRGRHPAGLLGGRHRLRLEQQPNHPRPRPGRFYWCVGTGRAERSYRCNRTGRFSRPRRCNRRSRTSRAKWRKRRNFWSGK